ncbi:MULTISPECIES: hypothetical protein [Nostoc]|uniref:Uncharacterized protein n=1 Tax=Nostoc paludosum FACHB-159 TaxID=2692908 RepID=A0ABR8KJZ6_9NOSO|nr:MULTISPECIES: hypothetical protein [Nostoc]MBD2682731.1 hypothetical protein [Nostoc sp. FACHB-857]MBD2739066.1 hypothetical protein [Nostoc paludosum FACHB-159]
MDTSTGSVQVLDFGLFFGFMSKFCLFVGGTNLKGDRGLANAALSQI